MTKTASTIVVISIWFFATLVALPALINSQAITYTFAHNEQRTICTLVWSDGFSGKSKSDNLYNIFLFVVTYVVPMGCMSVTYTLMARVLWGSSAIGEMSRAQRVAVKSKQKVVPMLITVTVVFGICWLPYHLYFLYIYYDIRILAHKFVQHVYLSFYFLAMLNSFLNPVIYCLLNQ
ncbi:tachykinin-like peptides receptor 86C, partial [Dinothrombium tinctorium]